MKLRANLCLMAAIAGTAPALANDDLSRWSAYAPKGWRIISAVEGKMGTPLADGAVLVAEQESPALRVRNGGLGTSELNLNPRHLLILEKGTSGYTRIAHNANLLPSEGDAESPCLADPLAEGGVSLDKGIVSIKLQYWLSCGGWGVTNRTYKFRREATGFRLIGAEVFSFARNGGPGEETSVNYLTGRKKMTTGIEVFAEDDIAGPVKPKVAWGRVAKAKFYLDSMDRKDCERDDKPGWCLD